MSGRAPALAGVAALAALLLAQLLLPAYWRTSALDQLLTVEARVAPRESPPQPFDVVVIDIDRASLDAMGAWPWPRATMARLVEAAAAMGPAAIGIDILFADVDQRSPAALARQLAALTQRPDLRTLANSLPDGDKLLAAAITATPAALGFVLDPDGRSDLPGATFLTQGRPILTDLWKAEHATGPAPLLMEAASGLGALSLLGDQDGIVRQVPLLVAVDGVVLPGLALETLRLALASDAYRLAAEPDGGIMLGIGERRIRLPAGAAFRMLPDLPGSNGVRTIPALDLLQGKVRGLRDSIVMIGGSAPELGGLRPTPGDPLTPSVQIHAHALAQLMSGRVVLDVPAHFWLERAGSLALGILAILLALWLGPLPGLLAMGLACLAWGGATLLLLQRQNWLMDPVGPLLTGGIVFAVTVFTSFIVTRRRELRLRESFAQRLHPAVVERLARQPERLKLAGERRFVTILATDLEGFTSLTYRLEPQELIALLDRYLEGICRIVVEHGGMIDKLVGDAVHSIFNAPMDLPDHPSRALDAALAILAWTEAFRTHATAGLFGRTRIGLESGPVIVGDVGLGTRLDYTAYGDAMNLAVRLEGTNKQLGTSILVGPSAAEPIATRRLRPLGPVPVRGFKGPVELFMPAQTAV